MSRRRVVVTGLGCVSPVGNTVQDSWANILAGKSGIDLITKFVTSNFACKIAGEVKGFDLESYISAKDARTMTASSISALPRLRRRCATPACLPERHWMKNWPRA